MATRKYNHRRAFTLVEVLVAALAAVILIVGISAMLYYAQRGYNTMYRRVTSDVVRNAYEARRVFDTIARKSTLDRCDIHSHIGINDEIYLYYYYDETAPIAPDIPVDRYRYMFPAQPNRFARFYVADTAASDKLELYVERGLITYAPGATLFTLNPDVDLEGTGTSMILAKNVRFCRFGNAGESSVRIVLILDDEDDPAPIVYSETQTLKMAVTTTAIRHNTIR